MTPHFQSPDQFRLPWKKKLYECGVSVCFGANAGSGNKPFKKTTGAWNKLVRNIRHIVDGGRADAGLAIGLGAKVNILALHGDFETGSVDSALLESSSGGPRIYSGTHSPSAFLRLGKGPIGVGWVGGESRSYWGAEDTSTNGHWAMTRDDVSTSSNGEIEYSVVLPGIRVDVSYDLNNFVDGLTGWYDNENF